MESLEDIQVGDVVVVDNCGRLETKRVALVSRVTKQHFMIGDSDSKYRKSTGKMVSSDQWTFVTASRPKPGEIDQIKAYNAAITARYFVEKHIESIRHTPAAFVPIAKFIKENMKPEKDDA